MNRQAQSVVLLLVGGAVLRASLTDLYLRYVKEGLRPFLIAAGAALVLAAIMTLWYEMRRPAGSAAGDVSAADASSGGVSSGTADAAHAHEGDDGHNHGAGGPRVAWLLILPVLGLVLVTPPALGSYSASRSGTALTAVSDFAPLPEGDPVEISMLDYATRAVFDEGRSLGDRRVELSGFLLGGPEGTWVLARIVVGCCAADGRPVKIALTGDLPAGLAADDWLRVVGRYTPESTKDTVNGERIPYLQVLEAEVVPTPVEQYET